MLLGPQLSRYPYPEAHAPMDGMAGTVEFVAHCYTA
jgi:hypothetical protein